MEYARPTTDYRLLPIPRTNPDQLPKLTVTHWNSIHLTQQPEWDSIKKFQVRRLLSELAHEFLPVVLTIGRPVMLSAKYDMDPNGWSDEVSHRITLSEDWTSAQAISLAMQICRRAGLAIGKPDRRFLRELASELGYHVKRKRRG